MSAADKLCFNVILPVKVQSNNFHDVCLLSKTQIGKDDGESSSKDLAISTVD